MVAVATMLSGSKSTRKLCCFCVESERLSVARHGLFIIFPRCSHGAMLGGTGALKDKMNKARAVRTEKHCSCVQLFSHSVIKCIEGTALDSPMCFLIKASPLALMHVLVGYENSLPMTEQNTVERFFSNGC